MQKNIIAALLGLSVLAFGGTVDAKVVQSHETIYQPALLQSLTLGYYDGFITVKNFKKLGDTGIGTFQGVNGELIALNGHVYQALGDGSVVEAAPDETIPFGNITHFDVDYTEQIVDVKDMARLKAIVDRTVNTMGKNYFYMVKIDGTFNSVLVRSEIMQHPPYRPLAQALAVDQREFTYEDIGGTLVALYCPSFVKGVNTPGWHSHFVSDKRDKGGHVLALDIKNGTISYDVTKNYSIVLPEDENFGKLDLGVDQSKDIHKVEQAEKKDL